MNNMNPILSQAVKELEERLIQALADKHKAQAELAVLAVSMDRKLLSARAASRYMPEEIEALRSANVQLRAELEGAKTRELLLKSSSEEMRQWFREYHDLRRRMPMP